MKIVLSRKGFDSSSGEVPSPILPDGTLLPQPIPDRRSVLSYDEVRRAPRRACSCGRASDLHVLFGWLEVESVIRLDTEPAPGGGRPPMGGHGRDLTRWRRVDGATRLRSVPRGQEFALDADAYPEAEPWARSIISLAE